MTKFRIDYSVTHTSFVEIEAEDEEEAEIAFDAIDVAALICDIPSWEADIRIDDIKEINGPK